MASKSNAERQKAWRERQALKKNQQASSTLAEGNTATGEPVGASGPVAGAAEPEEQVTVSVNTPEQVTTHVSLKERLFGKKEGIQPIKKPARAASRGKSNKKDFSLISGALPAMMAGLLVTFIRDRLPEEYRPCAPTQLEASAILRPLFDELSRYFEVTGKISETAVNLILCMTAMIAYGARSYVTYVEIKHDLEKGVKRHEQQPISGSEYSNGYRGNQAAVSGIDGTDPAGYAGNDGGRYAGDDSSNGAIVPDGSEQRELSDADRVANLFRRDRQGRVQLGLLAS